jgi:putative endonuclease
MRKKTSTTNCTDNSKANNKVTGNWGEAIAAEELIKKGYSILHRNWKWGTAEVDIIAQHKQFLIFIEVKTRSTAKYGYPERAVNKANQQQYIRVAKGYIEKEKWKLDVRFDVISIIKLGEQRFELEHIKDAFFPYS